MLLLGFGFLLLSFSLFFCGLILHVEEFFDKVSLSLYAPSGLECRALKEDRLHLRFESPHYSVEESVLNSVGFSALQVGTLVLEDDGFV